ncbi:hypothetical protein Vretimale_8385 [Volvox reticuliferus]|uniref:RING-type domain-containing protein n=1 Tax=Volvox reticuliferus TaxID=1737510 RepID=A0A8J4GAU5_9CHLO|nr:hypothetical protein Vretimale_8385 [Volvox reticuliferus]
MNAAIVIDDEDVGKNNASAGPDTDASDCFICYSSYSDDSNHRPATLRCGHVAGDSCLRRWLRDKKFCPSCRKPAKLKDMTPIYNLPTRVVLAANGAGSAAVTAAAPNAEELAQKELMLQKVQRAYSEKEKEARLQAEEAQFQARQAKRRAEEANAKEQEVKWLRLELENAKRQLAAQQHPQAWPPATAGGWGNPGPNSNPSSDLAQPQRQQPGAISSNGDSGDVSTDAAVRFTLPPPALVRCQGRSDPRLAPGANVIGVHLHPHELPASSQWVSAHAAQPLGNIVGRGAAASDVPVNNWMPQARGSVPVAGGLVALVPPPPAGSMWGHFSASEVVTARSHRSAGDMQRHSLRPDSTRVTHYGAAARWPPAPLATGIGAWDGGGGVAGGMDLSSSSRALFDPLFGLEVEGCRLLALDAAGARLLVSEMRSGGTAGGGTSCSFIRKISMHAPESQTRVRLRDDAGIVYDMQLPDVAAAPAAAAGPRLLAVATQGAGLCLACPQSDNVVATFKGLPYKAWSCSWVPAAAGRDGSGGGSNSAGPYGENLLVAGLAMGHIALLDIRRTDQPVAVLPALQNQAMRGCAQMPIRTVTALPCGPDGAGYAAAAGGGGVLWPTCALSCPKCAWLMVDGGEGRGDGLAEAKPPSLLCIDGGFGSGGMQLESLSAYPSDWDWRGRGGSGVGGRPWRVVLSWRSADNNGAGGRAAGPRHEVGLLHTDEQAPYKHEATVTDYTRRGIQAVRSCLVPLGPSAPTQHQPPYSRHQDGEVNRVTSESSEEVLLVSSDDDTRQPLVWSLRASSTGGGDGGGPQIVQRLERHPEVPSCMVASSRSGGAGGEWYLGCGSQRRVFVYRRRVDDHRGC